MWRYQNEGRSDALSRCHATTSVKSNIRSYFQKECQKAGKSVMLEKTPQNCLRVGFIDEVFPSAKFIHIIRDPYESILSIKENWIKKGKGLKGVRVRQRLSELQGTQFFRYGWQFLKRVGFAFGSKPVVIWGPRLPGIEGMVKDLSLIEVAAHQWKYSVEWACWDGRRLGSDRYMEFRLDELNSATLGKILNFCDLKIEDRVEAFFEKEFDGGQINYRSEGADAGEIDKIKRIVEPTMEWLKQTSDKFNLV